LLVDFIDSDWDGDLDDKKSIVMGYVFITGSRSVTWTCKKQKGISLYSIK
jgi:hypothetical protein